MKIKWNIFINPDEDSFETHCMFKVAFEVSSGNDTDKPNLTMVDLAAAEHPTLKQVGGAWF